MTVETPEPASSPGVASFPQGVTEAQMEKFYKFAEKAEKKWGKRIADATEAGKFDKEVKLGGSEFECSVTWQKDDATGEYIPTIVVSRITD